MIYCVSRTYSKTNKIQHQKSSSISTINSKPPETSHNSIHNFYVSNNMMLSILTVSGQESSNNQSQITQNTQDEDNQFYSYRKQLQKQLSERKVKRNYDLEPQTREDFSRQSIHIPVQIEPQQYQRQSSRTVPNLVQISSTPTKVQKLINPLIFNSCSNEISFGQYKFKKNEILQDENSMSNIQDDNTQIQMPMKFQPFQFKFSQQ
ncbi:unnamed protein product [Paramecium sonneborni]|uniref:Uncharacterized protein n=1 Tax=Paramecium sonneborni TaxID=65129 RepID=A0A8S1P4H6_9CILI|nr:unnamed protein product [Paramecium sonneborni]